MARLNKKMHIMVFCGTNYFCMVKVGVASFAMLVLTNGTNCGGAMIQKGLLEVQGMCFLILFTKYSVKEHVLLT